MNKLEDFHNSVAFDKTALKAYKKKYVIGIDEVGTGAIAGPIYSMASIVNLSDIINSKLIYYVKNREHIIFPTDSKLLSEYERSLIFYILRRFVMFSGCGVVTASEIDEHKDMTKSRELCWTRALQNLFIDVFTKTQGKITTEDVVIFSDAFKINYKDIPCNNIIKGDFKSVSIAVSSILAKVARDMYMSSLHNVHPKYNWTSNKGYTENKHMEAIKKNGATIYHRHSFSNVKDALVINCNNGACINNAKSA